MNPRPSAGADTGTTRIEVTYVQLDVDRSSSASGFTRMALGELIDWLANRPGCLILSIRRLT